MPLRDARCSLEAENGTCFLFAPSLAADRTHDIDCLYALSSLQTKSLFPFSSNKKHQAEQAAVVAETTDKLEELQGERASTRARAREREREDRRGREAPLSIDLNVDLGHDKQKNSPPLSKNNSTHLKTQSRTSLTLKG